MVYKFVFNNHVVCLFFLEVVKSDSDVKPKATGLKILQ